MKEITVIQTSSSYFYKAKISYLTPSPLKEACVTGSDVIEMSCRGFSRRFLRIGTDEKFRFRLTRNSFFFFSAYFRFLNCRKIKLYLCIHEEDRILHVRGISGWEKY